MRSILLGLVLGVAVTAIGCLASMFSLARYGDLIEFIFPYGILLVRSNVISERTWIIITIAQFPLYGSLIGFAATKGVKAAVWTIVAMSVAHIVAVAYIPLL